ncbi:hypothetical protein Hanom_Chr12g01137971 [Helianthus anomalus]
MIPYVWLIIVVIMQQNCLSENSLWIIKPVDYFNLVKMSKGSHIYVQSTEHHHNISDRDTRYTFEYTEQV